MKSINRYRTSLEAEKILEILMNTLKLSSKAAIMRIGIGLSLTDPALPENYMKLDKKGFEIHKQILFGDDEQLFEALIKYHYLNKKHIDNDMFYALFFPDLVGAHIERGLRMLHSEYRFSGNMDNLIKNLLKKME